MNLDLIKNILIVAIASSVISTAIIQKIKEQLTNKKVLAIVSLIVSMLAGFLFAISFSELSWQNAIWVGVATYVGADALYKAFEDKIFKSFSSMNSNVNVPAENKIVFEEASDDDNEQT